MFEKFRTVKRGIWVHIAEWQIDDFSRVSSRSVSGWGRLGRWCAGRRWSWLWNPHSASGGWRCTCSFAYSACLRILGSALLVRKPAGCLVLTKLYQVSLYRRPHLDMPRTLNTPFISSETSARGFLLRYFVSPIAARNKPSFAILAIFNARNMSDCTSCTRPPCLAIVADMLKTYKTSVPASNNEIQLLPPTYTLQ